MCVKLHAFADSDESLAKLAVIGPAILKKSLIFLFDEATSSLYGQTEKEISKLDAVLKSYTKPVITHRNSSVGDAMKLSFFPMVEFFNVNLRQFFVIHAL